MNKIETEAKQRQLEEIQREQKKKMAEDLKKKSEAIGIKIDWNADLPPEEILAMQVAKIENEKREMKQRLTTLARKIDHIERAQRREEIPLLEKDYERQKKADIEFQSKAFDQMCEVSKARHEVDLEIKSQVAKLRDDASAFREVATFFIIFGCLGLKAKIFINRILDYCRGKKEGSARENQGK